VKTLAKMITECVEAGVGAAVILSGGGRETGEKGRKIRDRKRGKARSVRKFRQPGRRRRIMR